MHFHEESEFEAQNVALSSEREMSEDRGGKNRENELREDVIGPLQNKVVSSRSIQQAVGSRRDCT